MLLKPFYRNLLTSSVVIFNDYSSEPSTPGRWTYALPTHAALAHFSFSQNSQPLEAAALRKLVMNSHGRLTGRSVWYDHDIHVIWIPQDHPLYETHQINLLDDYDQDLNRLMVVPPTYADVLEALLKALQIPSASLQSVHGPVETDLGVALPTASAKLNKKEWKIPGSCKGNECPRNEEQKTFVLDCTFDGYGKYIDRFANKIPGEFHDHFCTYSGALKWQQQCRRREINRGATQYGEVERGGSRYNEPATSFFEVWWHCFHGRYHKDDLMTEFGRNFPAQNRDKAALLAQANRVAARMKSSTSRAGTHITTKKDNAEYVAKLKSWREHWAPAWKEQYVANGPAATQNAVESESKAPKKRKQLESDEEADTDDEDETAAGKKPLKARRKH